MTEATANSVRGTSGGSSNTTPTGQVGAPMIMWAALALAVVVAGAGWTQYLSASRQLATAEGALATAQGTLAQREGELSGVRGDMQAMQATLAGAGLDAASPQALVLDIAAKRRGLTDLENAIVAKSAAVAARDGQLARASAQLAALEASSASAVAAETEASRLFADLDARNRVLGSRVAELESASVSWGAAAGARRQELDGLIAEVERNRAMIADAALWRERGAALTAEQARLARDVTDLENKIVALTAAVGFRQGELAKAVVAASAAEADARNAMVAALNYRAESAGLQADIVTFTDERARVNQALTEVNNRFIPALAAVEVREQQVRDLAASVAELETERAALVAGNTDLDRRLAAAEDRLAEVTTVTDQASGHLKAIQDLLAAPTVEAAMQTN